MAMLSERRKLYENRSPGGCPRNSKMASGRPPGGTFVPVRLHLTAKAARKPSWGSSGGALEALLALGPSGSSRGGAPGLFWKGILEVGLRRPENQQIMFISVIYGSFSLPCDKPCGEVNLEKIKIP